MGVYGFKTVHDAGEGAEVDIVFVHGLRGNREETWTKGDVLWPEYLLAKDVENSRILLYGYDSGIIHRDQAKITQTDLESDAQALCANLAAERSKTGTNERLVIFVAHSLGGLVCAQAQVIGDRGTRRDNPQLVAQKTRGIVFLGTPFRGSKVASLGEHVRRILGLGMRTQKETFKDLKVDSEKLKELGAAFPAVMRKRNESRQLEDKIGVIFFRENLPTHGVMIVEPESAHIPGCGESAPINANHLDICKFDSADDQGYGLVLAAIRKFMAKPGSAESAKQTQVINNYGKAQYLAQNITITAPQENHF